MYLVVALAFLFWLLFDVWARQHSLVRGLGYQNVERLNSPTFRLVAFTFLAGAKQMLFMFAAGVLAGYGSHDVFLWLDDQVTRIFERAGGGVDEGDGADEDNGGDEGGDN